MRKRLKLPQIIDAQQIKNDRHKDIIVSLLQTEGTYQDVGSSFNVSRQRIHQIASIYGIYPVSEKVIHNE